ncbi:MAG: hypothetical protein IKR41_11690 [Bacteroidales bacterium]|nr:hypothetical protein [Bacteroidales bacterium]
MIVFNGQIYRTLADKFYIGGTQIGKVYHGNTLVYPEPEEKQIIKIDDVVIDTTFYPLNGNIYDLGIAADRNTCFEICFIAHGINAGCEFFGSHHDNRVTPAYTYYLNSDGSRGNKVGNETYGVNRSGVGGYKNQTKFHVQIWEGHDHKMSFRYGCNQDAGSQGEHIIKTKPKDGEAYFLTFDDSDKIFGGVEYGPYYYDSLYKNDLENPEYLKAKSSFNGIEKVAVSRSDFSSTEISGNLWINGINSKTNSPNQKRPFSVDANGVLKYNDDDIIFHHCTSNSAFIYALFWEKGDKGSRILFRQRKIQVNGKEVIVFDRFSYNTENDCFNSKAEETIFPFKYCKPL